VPAQNTEPVHFALMKLSEDERLFRDRSFDFHAIDEAGTGPDERQELRCIDSAPAQITSPGVSRDSCSKIGRRRLAVSQSSSGNTRTLPTTDMKLVSPVQRGTR